jgi:hypothetical protein
MNFIWPPLTQGSRSVPLALHALAKSQKGDLYTLLTEQSTWVSMPDPGLVLHALAKSEKGDLYTFLMEQSTWVSVPDLGLVLHAHAKSEKGTKPFLRRSRSGPPTLYTFATLIIQTGSSLYAAPLTRGAGLLFAMPTHRFDSSGLDCYILRQDTTSTTRGLGC